MNEVSIETKRQVKVKADKGQNDRRKRQRKRRKWRAIGAFPTRWSLRRPQMALHAWGPPSPQDLPLGSVPPTSHPSPASPRHAPPIPRYVSDEQRHKASGQRASRPRDPRPLPKKGWGWEINFRPISPVEITNCRRCLANRPRQSPPGGLSLMPLSVPTRGPFTENPGLKHHRSPGHNETYTKPTSPTRPHAARKIRGKFRAHWEVLSLPRPNGPVVWGVVGRGSSYFAGMEMSNCCPTHRVTVWTTGFDPGLHDWTLCLYRALEIGT